MANETFPIDLGKLQPLELDPAVSTLTDVQKAARGLVASSTGHRLDRA